MPIDDLTALGQKMREARKNKELTQQELSDLSHVSVKQIANIEKGKMNPSYLILRALAKVLHISLDTLINPDVSLEDEGVNQMKMLYSSCPPDIFCPKAVKSSIGIIIHLKYILSFRFTFRNNLIMPVNRPDYADFENIEYFHL